MNLFDYPMALPHELKRLGYDLHLEPTEQDIMFTKIILNSEYCELRADIEVFNQWHFRDVTKPALKVYAYYINNPQQFSHDPQNIVGSGIKQILNASCSFLNCIYKKPPTHYIKARPKHIKRYMDEFLTIYYPSAKALALRVQHNTLLQREDLNIADKVNINLFR